MSTLLMDASLARQAVRHFGLDAQLQILQEELAEAIVAISHLRRGRCGSREDVVDAIGDVLVMIDQLRTEPFMADELDASVALKCERLRARRGSGMNSAPVTCPRLGRVISSGACCGIICSTPSRQELGLCLSCPVGQRLAMTCPFYTKMHAVPDQGATRPAEAALREVLRFVLPRYKTDRSFGFKFLSVVAQAQFHWHGRPEDLEGAARNAGLTMRKRPWGIARDAALTRFVEVGS